MDNLIISFSSIGEAGLTIVDDKTYDLLYELYENQEAGSNGYSEMMEKFWKTLEECEEKSEDKFQHICLQWNSHDNLKEPVTFKRILQVLEE